MSNILPTGRRIALFLLLAATSPLPVHAVNNGCATGGQAIADVYFYSDPMYALFFGDHLTAYVEQNAGHFRAGGDAVRCASALAIAYMQQAVRLYDPTDDQRRQQLENDLAKIGIPSGPADPSPSAQYLFLSMRLTKLARGLPAAAEGNFGPLRTPTSEIELLQQQATALLAYLFQQAPEVGALFQEALPMMAELNQIQHRSMLQTAHAIADGP